MDAIKAFGARIEAKLVDNWRRVVLLSLSFWMQVLGVAALILPELYYRLTGNDYDPYFFWWIGVLLLLAGIIGRVWQQGVSPLVEWLRIIAIGAVIVALALILATPSKAESLDLGRGNAAVATEAQTLQIAVPFIAKEEGERNRAYLDAVGVPTICFGSTRGVHLGMVKSHQECLALLWLEVAEHRTGLHRYFTPTTIATRLPPTRDAAYTSTAFNVGFAGIGKSTATRRLNEGDIVGGCQALTWFDKGGGRVLRGLFERRKREKALCMLGAA
ncbi:lysozyme [Mesorhizobium qingshengii]|uniref:Lysozyme n=1 Tax=Mesorhizobium qingshengii TaxID=1165689 RepID=A0A1G5V133_9HYPH|nr:lysozyme [Mesorhizobium qingshengii]SDA39328.1 Phage-related lysozyme (muramidase), GH24 family [Mesorhizobium qingshengii]